MKGATALLLLCLVAAIAASKEDKKDKDKDDIGTVIGIDLGTTYSWYVYHLMVEK